MDAQQFLAEFGHIANAPGGLSQLRDLVLHFAVTGKLVQQTATDEHAEKVLERMGQYAAERNSKKRGRSAKKISTQQTLTESSFPTGWILAELGKLGDWGAGSTPSRSNPAYYSGSIPWFKSGELKSDYITKSEEFVSELALKECSLRLNVPGDILIAMYGANIGQTSIVGVESTTNQAVCACTPYEGLINRFLLLTLRAMKMHFIGLGAGGAQPNISKEKIVAACVGLPPTEEQSRIVAKVDELMALCDKLETQQQDRRKLQNNLRQSTLQSVATANSPHELQSTWTRLADNFGRLFYAREDVVELRNLILDLAVHGLLVNQLDLDIPIGEWLPGIGARKADLAKQKRISRQTALEDVTEDEYPFQVPKGWAFVRLGQITNKIGSGSTPRGGREVYVKEGIPFLRSQNVRNDGLRLVDVACITPEEHERMSGTAVLGKDVLLNITGASLGRCALVPSEFSEANVSQHVTIIRLTDPQVREYLHLCILSPYTQAMIWGRQVGMAREGLSKKVLEQFEIPLPPIAEQHRIVGRVAELMRFCDVLEGQLQHANDLAERLASTTVASITGISTEQEEEPMKAPQTELIAPLILGNAPDIKEQSPLATILARHHGEMPAKDLWQRFGGEIDAFYAQLKTEVAHGWILEPAIAEMREKRVESADA
jgi:type I restriction enzyme S subunit